MSAPSAKGLFQATKPKAAVDPRQGVIMELTEAFAPARAGQLAARDPLDYDPTPPEATRALLTQELPHLRKHGSRVWEPAVGAGHIALVLEAEGFEVLGNDVVDRGWRGVELCSFFDCTSARAPIHFTNPPYGEISAGNAGGRWLRHAMDLGCDYLALLLGAEWPFGMKNGLGALIAAHPPSVEYFCRWKIDFRGQGNPAQRNCWFVWDVNRPPPEGGGWVRRPLDRAGNPAQGGFDLGVRT